MYLKYETILDNVEVFCDHGMRIGHLLGELCTAQEVSEINQLISTTQHIQMSIAVKHFKYYIKIHLLMNIHPKLPRLQTRKTTDSLEGLSFHSNLERSMQTFTAAQHLHVHGVLVLEVLFGCPDEDLEVMVKYKKQICCLHFSRTSSRDERCAVGPGSFRPSARCPT